MKVSVVLSFSLNFFFVSQSLAEKSITTSLQNGVRKTHESGELIFEDNFDFLDFDKWEHEITMAGGGNWEFQVYWNNRTNSYCHDSTLFLAPKLTADRFGEEFVNWDTLIYGAVSLEISAPCQHSLVVKDKEMAPISSIPFLQRD